MKFALVGCGRISSKHVEALENIKDAKIVACADPVFERAEKAAAKIKCEAYNDYHKMLENHKEVDIVTILTPSGMHAEHAIDIVETYKKHIVVEKPMALRLSDADEMIKVCDENRVRMFVVKQNRFNLPVLRLRKELEKGRFGKLVLGTIRVRWKRDQEYYDQDSWRGTWEMDGGVLANQASHHIDLLEWMLGDPLSVVAKTGTYLVDIETEDTGVAVIKFKCGALGIVEATTAARPRDIEGSLSLLGERGTVEIGGFAVNKMKIWDFIDVTEDEKEEVLRTEMENPPNVYGYGHMRFLENVLEAIKTNGPAIIDGIEGRKSLELINAIYESAETGREVFLHFHPRYSKLGINS